jgi:hypothetical protein
MFDQTVWTNSMINMARQSLEMSMRNMEMFQNQAKEAVELTMNNADKMQGATRKACDFLSENMDKARKTYVDAMEQGWSYFEQQYPNAKPKTK